MKPKRIHRCRECKEILKTGFALVKHLRALHPQSKPRATAIKCVECDLSYPNRKELRCHLVSVHNWESQLEELVFPSVEHFETWKDRIENNNNVKYVVSSNRKNNSNYYCNRSYKKPKTVSQGLRQTKSQGSCKLPYLCTSQIVTYNRPEGVTVKWFKSHYGHSEDQLEHVPLSKLSRQEIASKLIRGLPPTRILQSVAENISDKPNRMNLLTLQDVDNIANSLKLTRKSGNWHSSDAFSVDSWVSQCLNESKCPILMYKKPMEHNEQLEYSDYVLIYMNQHQRQMLQTRGEHCIAVDCLNGPELKNIHLVTLMAMDEFDSGFPVAFMFTNRVDTLMFTVFFQAIKDNVGSIKTEVFIAEKELDIYTAFTNIMPYAETVYYGSHHVQKAWESNLKKIKSVKLRGKISKALKDLNENVTIDTLTIALDNFLKLLQTKESFKRFYEYFRQDYSTNFEKWAMCFRDSKIMNINDNLEGLHKTLKMHFLNRKHDNKLDKAIGSVIVFLTGFSSKRQTSLVKKEITKKCTENYKIHKSLISVNIQFDFTQCDKDQNIFVITDCSDMFTVFKADLDINCCGNYCSDCNICIHAYTCDCDQYLKSSLICKHIHFTHSTWVMFSRHFEAMRGELKNVVAEEIEGGLMSTGEADVLADNDDLSMQLLIKETAESVQNVLVSGNSNVIEEVKKHLMAINQLCYQVAQVEGDVLDTFLIKSVN